MNRRTEGPALWFGKIALFSLGLPLILGGYVVFASEPSRHVFGLLAFGYILFVALLDPSPFR